MNSMLQRTSKIKLEPHTSAIENDTSQDQSHPKGNILHIGNIHPKLTYEQIKQGLYNLFSVHGPIYDITIKTKENGNHFAFVDFPDIRDTEKALIASKRQGKILQGQQLIVNYCEDPKKNQDRKDQKCFLCHNNGHKARNCPVKPQLIKHQKKNHPKDQAFDKKVVCFKQDSSQTLSGGKNICSEETLSQHIGYSSQSSELSSQDEQITKESPTKSIMKRDKDYLRFLKLKKRLLQQKLYKRHRSKKKKSDRYIL